MNLREFKADLRKEIIAGNAVLAQSGSGIGKSEAIMQVFSALKAEGAAKGERWGLGVIFAATQTPTDLIGVQWKGERAYNDGKGGTRMVTITDPSIPLWMISVPHGEDPGGQPAWCYDRFFLFIDEYGQGELDTKRAMAEIFLHGGTAPFYLPPGSPVVAATNIGARYGVSKDFDFCITRRKLKVITGDADIWEQDFASKPYTHNGRKWEVMAYTRAWAKSHPTILFEDEPKDQGPWCNPRALCAADRYVQVCKEQNGGKVPLDDYVLMESVAGGIGMPACESYVGGMKFALELPSYDDVIKDPKKCPVPKRADLMMVMAFEMAHYTKEEHIPEVLTYIQRMAATAKDMEVTFISALLRKDYKRVSRHEAMQTWIGKNAALVSVIASMNQ